MAWDRVCQWDILLSSEDPCGVVDSHAPCCEQFSTAPRFLSQSQLLGMLKVT